MGLPGRLTKDRFGASMPVDAPYYQQPPFYYRDVHNLSVAFATDAESAAELLPEGTHVADPAQGVVSVIWYPTTTFGPYNEAILGIPCDFEGREHLYIAHIVVDTVPPLAGGREIWGYPKKMATLALEDEQELLRGTIERPQGVRLATERFGLLELPAPGVRVCSHLIALSELERMIREYVQVGREQSAHAREYLFVIAETNAPIAR